MRFMNFLHGLDSSTLVSEAGVYYEGLSEVFFYDMTANIASGACPFQPFISGAFPR